MQSTEYLTGKTKPHLVMVIEPETKVRFRYESEGGSHGGLPGKQKEKGKKVYPTVKLEDYYGNKRVYIRVSLYTDDRKRHVIEFIGQNKQKMLFIDEYLDKNNRAKFTNLKFLNKKKEEIFQLLVDQKMEELGEKRKSVRTRFEEKYSKELKERAKNIMNSVRLCFEAFEEDNSEIQLCEPLFSELICNQKTASKGELRIHRMSRVSGSWEGGDEVILLCDKIQKDNINIIFYETDDEFDCTGEKWKANATFSPADVHYQVAITFRTPRYKMNMEKTVNVCLSRDDEMGEPLQFKYIPDYIENPSKKRKVYSSGKCIVSAPNQEDSKKSTAEPSLGESNVSNMPVFTDFLIDMKDLGIDIENLDVYNLCDILPEIENEPAYISDQHLSLESKTDIDFAVHNELDAKSMNKFKRHRQNAIHLKEIREKIYSYLLKTDDCGNTYLHMAVYQDKNVTSILKISQFSNIDIVNLKNYYQQTPLHIAVEQNNKELVKTLLLCSSNPNLINASGNNCYHEACDKNYFDVMWYLLNQTAYKPELNSFNYEGLTPLHIAVKKNSIECYHLLKLHFSGMNTLDQKSGKSLLHYAIEFQQHFVKILLDEGEIDVNIQDLAGNTPLHLACSKGDIEIIKELIKAGSDPNIKNFKKSNNMLKENLEGDGQTPADLTTNVEILELLRQSSNKISRSDEMMKKLCNILDANNKWEQIAIYFMDEKYINSLKCSPRPSEQLLFYIKKEPNYMEELQNAFEIIGLHEALDIIKQAQI